MEKNLLSAWYFAWFFCAFCVFCAFLWLLKVANVAERTISVGEVGAVVE
jgi:hypothetical protein